MCTCVVQSMCVPSVVQSACVCVRQSGCGCVLQACYLQIHNMYSVQHGVRAAPPMSVENAVGIILVHGGSPLSTTDYTL